MFSIKHQYNIDVIIKWVLDSPSFPRLLPKNNLLFKSKKILLKQSFCCIHNYSSSIDNLTLDIMAGVEKAKQLAAIGAVDKHVKVS